MSSCRFETLFQFFVPVLRVNFVLSLYFVCTWGERLSPYRNPGAKQTEDTLSLTNPTNTTQICWSTKKEAESTNLLEKKDLLKMG